MTKTITFSGTAGDVSPDDRDAVLAAGDGWHDPDAGRVVNHVTYTFTDQYLSVSVRRTDVDVDSVQDVRDTLATAIGGLPIDFGTAEEIKEAIDIQ